MIIGYARVSTSDQTLNLQTDALKAAGCERIFQETASGIKQDRPELLRMLESLREGDEVVVWKLDRLGRSTRHLLELVEGFDAAGVTLRSATEGISTQGPMGRMVLTIMAAVATLERETIIERTRAGLDAARLRGRTGGRPPALSPKQVARGVKLKADGLTVPEVAAVLGVSTPTAYRYLAKAGA